MTRCNLGVLHLEHPQDAAKQAIWTAVLQERRRQEQLKAEGRFRFTCADPTPGAVIRPRASCEGVTLA